MQQYTIISNNMAFLFLFFKFLFILNPYLHLKPKAVACLFEAFFYSGPYVIIINFFFSFLSSFDATWSNVKFKYTQKHAEIQAINCKYLRVMYLLKYWKLKEAAFVLELTMSNIEHWRFSRCKLKFTSLP